MKRLKVGDKVMIAPHAHYGQDFSFWEWGTGKTIFTIKEFPQENKAIIIAHGYGILGDPCGNAYGNGAIFINPQNLIATDDEDWNPFERKKEIKWIDDWF